MAWCDNHWDGISLARDVQDTDLAEDALTYGIVKGLKSAPL